MRICIAGRHLHLCAYAYTDACSERERERGAKERERESERAGWGLVPVSIKGCWSSGLLPHKNAGEQSPTHMSPLALSLTLSLSEESPTHISPSALRSPILMPLCCSIFTQNYNAESDE